MTLRRKIKVTAHKNRGRSLKALYHLNIMSEEFNAAVDKIAIAGDEEEEADEEKRILQTQIDDLWQSLEKVEAKLAKTINERDVGRQMDEFFREENNFISSQIDALESKVRESRDVMTTTYAHLPEHQNEKKQAGG